MVNKISMQKYITFIDYVAKKIIEDGIEYKEFWIAYTTATMFFGYKANKENDEIDVNIVWDKLEGIKVNVDNEEYSLIDIIFNVHVLKSFKNDFPIDYTVYKSMLEKIDYKINAYIQKENHKTPLSDALALLVYKLDTGIEQYQEKIKDINFSEIVELLQVVKSENNNSQTNKKGNGITSAK